jgi:hypothetical protein
MATISEITDDLEQLIRQLNVRAIKALPLLPESDSEAEPACPVRLKIRKPATRSLQVKSSFSCDTCGSEYKTKHLLDYHIDVVHSDKGFSCPCGKYKNPILTNVFQHVAARHCKEWLTPYKMSGGKCLFCSKECKSDPAYRQHCFNCVEAIPYMSKDAIELRATVKNLVKC